MLPYTTMWGNELKETAPESEQTNVVALQNLAKTEDPDAVAKKMDAEEKDKAGEGTIDLAKYSKLDLSKINPAESKDFLQNTWNSFIKDQSVNSAKTDKELTSMQSAFNDILKTSSDLWQKLQQLEAINPNSKNGVLSYIIQMKKMPTKINVSLETFGKNKNWQRVNINDTNAEQNPFLMNRDNVFKALNEKFAWQNPILNNVKWDGQQFPYWQIAMKQDNYISQKNISYGPDDFYTVQNLKPGQEMPVNKWTQQEEKVKTNLNYQAYAGYVIDNTTTPVNINGKQESFSSYMLVKIS